MQTNCGVSPLASTATGTCPKRSPLEPISRRPALASDVAWAGVMGTDVTAWNCSCWPFSTCTTVSAASAPSAIQEQARKSRIVFMRRLLLSYHPRPQGTWRKSARLAMGEWGTEGMGKDEKDVKNPAQRTGH
jgi:hypothetical protein